MKTFNQLINERKNTVEYKIEETKLDFLLNISKAMKERNISKSELAKKLGTSKSYVTKILQGDSVNFTIETMVKVCDSLDCKLETKIMLKDKKLTIDKNTRYQDFSEIWQKPEYNNNSNSSPVSALLEMTVEGKDQWI